MTCVCGASSVLPPAPSSRDPSQRTSDVRSGPYRASGVHEPDAPEIRCPYCANTCPSTVRVCPHCDVRFDNIRCDRCYSLQAPGAFTCVRCGQALELQPVLDPTDSPCPRCATPLESADGADGWGDARLHECPRCGGMFVPRVALAEILHRAEQSGPFPAPMRAPLKTLDQVKYIPCPLCRSTMNRVNFGKVSGVIVDVCRQHGTWFDSGELTRVVTFAASGGLAKTRAREEQEKHDHERERAQAHAQLTAVVARNNAEERLEELRSILQDLFFW